MTVIDNSSDRAVAYAACEDITRTQARNFFYGIRLLPAPKRRAMSAVYALARRIDDIGDGDLPAADKLKALDGVVAALGDSTTGWAPRGPDAALDAGPDQPPLGTIVLAVNDAAEHFPIPRAAFHELVDGVRMDVLGRRYQTFSELVSYCRCVAGSIGRLCVAIFGAPGAQDPADSQELADALGIALQQINILRDIREDLLTGRVYLPGEELERLGIELRLDDQGVLLDREERLAELIRYRAGIAEDWLRRGLELLPLLDRRSAACCSAMAGIYARLLERIEERPERVYAQRLSLSGWEKGQVAVRALIHRSALPAARPPRP
jgi:phytoene synthase